jgi:hypothetical protein
MKQVSIPAQITTFEDKIAGNLSLTQLFLLATPIFISFAFYGLLPKNFHLSLYKLVLIVLIAPIFIGLATRINGQLAINLIIVLLRYHLRVKKYLFNKNTNYLKVEDEPENIQTAVKEEAIEENKPFLKVDFNEVKTRLAELQTGTTLIKEKEGKLYVYITKDN